MEEKNTKNRKANVIANIIELIIVILYLIIGGNSIINNATSGYIAGMFREVGLAIFCLTLAILALAIVCLIVKSMRTKHTRRMAIWNIIWCISNFYFLFG